MNFSQKHTGCRSLGLALVCAAVVLLSLATAAPTFSQGALGLRTVVIDPGHGGKDPGTISLDGKTKEKDIALDIATRLEKKIKAGYPSVKVVMTRSTDVFIPLNDRADIANKASADLFISIHVNAAANKSARGYSVHVLGQSRDKNRDLFQNNLELSQRENSVITLEDDYTTAYEGFDPNDPESFIFFNLIQNAHLEQSLLFADCANQSLLGKAIGKSRGISQDPFLVLWRTTMPSVLVEVGFMTNETDLKVIRGEKGRQSIADGLYEGFVTFKKKFDESMNVPEVRPSTASEKSNQTASKDKPAPESGDVLYGTQVLASSRDMKDNDPFFKGFVPYKLKSGTLYRYILGTSTSLDKARELNKSVKKSFPDSWMVKIENGTTERVK